MAKRICTVKQQPQEQPYKSHERDSLLKHLQIDQSITKNYFSSSGMFMRQFSCVRDAGRRGKKIAGLVWRIFVSGYWLLED